MSLPYHLLLNFFFSTFRRLPSPSPSHLVIMENKVQIPRSLSVILHKLVITRRPLLLVITRQHALQANANALNIMNGAPALTV